jgi:adenine-specific DNA-methyltransferase
MSKINYHKHKDKRVNNPTMEKRNFFAEEERKPYDVLYPRDPSLDPQLVWKGKDEQDREDLAVPTVPIYKQEHIHPKAIIEDLRRNGAREKKEQQPNLFADFNGLDAEDELERFEKSTEFYRHENDWSNRMILGDSLLVMNSLAEKEGLKGKVQCIYIDPPYGIKFGSNWQVSTRKRDVKDGKPEDAAREPEVIRAFRDTWEKGIHSYLSYLRDRFVVARELLSETGSIFVQIGDENVHLVRCVLDEVFGSENFCANITFLKTAGKAGALLDNVSDVLLWYAKRVSQVKYRQMFLQKEIGVGTGREYSFFRHPDGSVSTTGKLAHHEILEQIKFGSRLFRYDNVIAQTASLTTTFELEISGQRYKPSVGGWKSNEAGLAQLARAARIVPRAAFVGYVRFMEDFPVSPISSVWDDLRWGFDAADKRYVVETNPRVVQRCILMTTDPGDLVLDPTCGSGTTAFVAEQWGRRWITIDTSRVALALARTRLMSAKFPYYLLADSPEGVKKESEITGQTPPNYEITGDIRKGFVYKRVPHVTLKSIANNPEIEPIYERMHPAIEKALADLNAALKDHGTKYKVETGGRKGYFVDFSAPDEATFTMPSGQVVKANELVEWEVPFEFPADWPEKARKPFEAFHAARRAMQKEMDDAIARHADTELLYDQPYEDNKRIRVTGPFTVESLSPHRVLPADEERPESEVEAQRDDSAADFANMVIENLRKHGVQNGRKKERLRFLSLHPHPGRWIHATGEYAVEGEEEPKRVAVSIGPEYGAVSPMQIKEAAKEAVEGIGNDLLVVCGYAFDPHVAEETKKYGNLTVLPTRMNADLSMGDELLKKTGAGNLFMVFGEPDVEVRETPEGIVVEIRGVDVYDPTTGEIRSSTTDDIACWFIDTNYDGEAFFVRHAYFTGADQPYERLRKALRAEIDDDAWASLYRTTSRPFPKPETGKFAVKVINHYGDEVLKVYSH